MPVPTPSRAPSVAVLRRTLQLVLTVLASLALGVAGSASAAPATSTSTAGPTTWHVYVGQQSPSGAIQGMGYTPYDVTIDVGDTVHWTSNSMEPHTVSFFDEAHWYAPFDPSVPYMVNATPETTIDHPGEFRSSGIMATMDDPSLPPPAQAYDLTFTGPGVYTYVCYVHGALQFGHVTVQPAGTPYPQTQHQMDAEFASYQAYVVAHGNQLWAQARQSADDHHVWMGAADETAMVMAFARPTVRINAGESVTFDMGLNVGMAVPHTVTFGHPANPLAPTGDPETMTPGEDLSSGVMLAAPFSGDVSDTYTVTFTEPGVYPYVCIFHAGMKMVGTVIVR